ncbi:MAG TPA: hypothetical protein VFD57_07200 [Clostridia bacterium]|nr:hypothetical protein [Clostridia bacterium]
MVGNMNYVLQDQEDIRWYFTLSEDNKIRYTKRQGGQWSDYEYIDSPPIESYSATIDNKGIIRILAYTTVRQLIYYERINERWNARTLERIYSRFQNISYFSIQCSDLGTHILCYIDNSLNKSAELLIHYYLYEGKWYGGRLWRFMSDQKTMPQALSIDTANRLHLLYTQNFRQRIHLYYCIYDPIALSWEEPTNIHSSASLGQYQLHVDEFQNAHIVWTEIIDGQYQIKYLSKSITNSTEDWKEVVLYRSENKIQSPVILDNDYLQCFWKEDLSIYKMISTDSGVTWSAPEFIPDSSQYDTALLNYTLLENNVPKTWSLWGQEYPDLRLLGFDWNAGDRLITSRNKKFNIIGSPDHIEIQQGISSLKRENAGLKDDIRNLFSEIQQLQPIVYNLQDQMQINEKALFNINARIKQLNFQVNQPKRSPRQANYNVIPSTSYQEEKKQPNPRVWVKAPPGDESTKEKPLADKMSSKQELLPEKEPLKEDKSPAPMNIPPIDESKYPIGETILQDKKLLKKVITPIVDDISEGDIGEKEKDIERISLGDTTILINPEDPDDY